MFVKSLYLFELNRTQTFFFEMLQLHEVKSSYLTKTNILLTKMLLTKLAKQ